MSDESVRYLAVPYIKNVSNMFRDIVSSVGYRITYSGCSGLFNIIRGHKDTIPKLSNNNVVYRINCSNCEASYTGQTNRLLSTRIREHQWINRSNPSIVHEHRININHEFDWDLTILNREPFYTCRLMSEMIHIKRQSSGINLQSDTAFLGDTYQ